MSLKTTSKYSRVSYEKGEYSRKPHIHNLISKGNTLPLYLLHLSASLLETKKKS